MAEKTDSSNSLPGQLSAAPSKGRLDTTDGEAVAVQALPVSGSA
jgi:hypothetical protein